MKTSNLVDRARGSLLWAYVRLAFRVLRDSMWRFKKLVLLAIGAAMAGISFQGGAMALVIGYAQRAQSDATISLAGREFVARDSIEILVLASVGSAGLLILSSIMTYLSFRLTVHLWQAYESFCAARVFSLLSSAGRLTFTHPDLSSDEASVIALARRDARYGGRALAIVVRTIVPAVTLVGAVGALFFLAPGVTVGVITVLVLSAPWVLRVNREAAQASRDLEEFSTPASIEYRRVVRWLNRSPYPLEDPDRLSSSFQDIESVRQADDAFRRYLLSTEKAGLVSGMSSALTLLVLMVALGGLAMREEAGFATFLAYVLVLVRGLASFRTLTRSISAVSRFYPQVKRYFAFVDEASQASRPDPKPVSCLPIVAHPSAVERSRAELELRVPSLTTLASPFPLTRYTMPDLLHALLWKDPDLADALWIGSTFATGSYEYLPGRPLRQSLGISVGEDIGQILDEIEPLVGPEVRDADWLDQLDEPPTGEEWLLLGDATRFAFAVRAALHSGLEWVFLEERAVRLEPPALSYLLELLSSKGVFIVYEPVVRAGDYGEDLVIALGKEGVVGIGDPQWFRSDRSVQHAVAEAAGIQLGAAGYIGQEESDDLGE